MPSNEATEKNAHRLKRRYSYVIGSTLALLIAAGLLLYFLTGRSASVLVVTLLGTLGLAGVAAWSFVASRDALEKTAAGERRRLAESEERYGRLYETSMDGILHTDMEGTVLECNKAFAEMLGYLPAELKGKTYFDITPGKWRGVDWDVITNQLLVTGHSDKYFKEYVRKDGSLVPVSVRAWLDEDEAGELSGIWARAEDISEQKRYEDFIRETIIRLEQANDRLREMDMLKTEFVAVVSHELRAPLAAIESALAAMKAINAASEDPRPAQLMSVLNRGVVRLSHLVDDLLDITRIESGQLRLEQVEVDPVELASRVVETYRARAEEKGVNLTLASNGGPCASICDPRRVEQVLVNLVDNALKFTPGGEVRVDVECAPYRAVYSVTDSGPGIPPELQDRVFEKFFSSPPVVESGTQGTGLGLAICRGIVEAHGGKMWVDSDTGRGATFHFEIPG
ncbi:MAG: PAS domain-containing sensor histidine kinase [Actinomycetota bacterium]